MRFSLLCGLIALPMALFAATLTYREETEAWRKAREASLTADTGWTTVVGLFWLREGSNPAGSASDSSIALPAGAPARVGEFLLRGGKVTFTAARGAAVTSGGKPVSSLEMRPDTQGQPTVIAIGDLSMFVLGRGKRFAVRLRDRNSRFRKEFKGLRWYPVNEAWRIQAKWVAYPAVRQLAIESITGDTENQPSPGYASFLVGGKEYRLEPVLEGDRLFFIFKDQTSGKETYPAGRFLYSPMPQSGTVLLDFNRAYSPPCAFSPYLTCPLPPPQNRLSIPIPAGELDYHH
ncbi:MAG: DUF1684 domain-containing protein [Bryobacterales bacterium]|nr:DUF1684 domain-containing protein [Bryobacterales bacterium]